MTIKRNPKYQKYILKLHFKESSKICNKNERESIANMKRAAQTGKQANIQADVNTNYLFSVEESTTR